MTPLSDTDGSWTGLKAAWRAQCLSFGEDFGVFAQGVFAVLDPLAAEGHPRAGIFGLEKDGQIEAIVQLNRALIPNYQGYVLRSRFLTPSPRWDYGDIEVDEYGDLMLEVFVGIFELSNTEDLRAPHLKFHLRSPADRPFFQALAKGLTKLDTFQDVVLRGSWLYVTKA